MAITVTATTTSPPQKAWETFTSPDHMVHWNAASDDWHTTRATVDLRVGGSFMARMEAKDGSFGFDFGGTYDTVEPYKKLAYTMGDGRAVSVEFHAEEKGTRIVETFDAEKTNPEDRQKQGWQAILDRFAAYVDSLKDGQ